ncbi:MAG: tyrosine-type recombinase/integrase [Patescibacteria group bacterium]|nr:tyrosine-type recombinase/integrase [Patescibacteria group bacterium]
MKLLNAIEQFNEWRKSRGISEHTLTGFDKDLRYFALFLKNKDLEKIKIDDIAGFINMSRELGWQDNSLHRKTMAFRKFFQFHFYQNRGVLNPMLIEAPRLKEKQPKIPTLESIEKLVAAIEEEPQRIIKARNKAIVTTLYDTGCRVGELCALDVDNVDIEEHKAVITTEKSNILRELFWSENSGSPKIIEEWYSIRNQEQARDNAFFISFSKNSRGKRLSRFGVNLMLTEYCSRARIERIHPHQFRHLIGIDAAKSGKNNSTISSLLGHKNVQSSFRYTRLYNKDLKEIHSGIR